MNIDLSREIEAYRRKRAELISQYGSAWVVFVEEDFKGQFPTFQDAAKFALDRFSTEQFLIRNTMEPLLHVPMVAVEG